MEKERRSKNAVHCIVLPFPAQGHVNPMLQFSKRLVHNGVKVTLALTRFISKSLVGDTGPIAVETISDGYDEGGFAIAESPTAYFERFQVVGSETLTILIEKLKTSSSPVDCVVYDAFITWPLDVARELGLVGAVFFTQACTVNNIYYNVHRGMIKLPISEPELVMVPGLTFPLQASDLPSFIHLYGSYPRFFDMVVNDQFCHIDKVDWMFCNTFYMLEDKVVDWMAKLCPLGTIGPTLPSAYLDKRLEDDTDYALNMLKPAASCIEWLDSKADESVVYVSFGSNSVLEPQQMEEIVWGVRRSNAYFLMVVRESDEPKLPENFKVETAEKGLVVSWCPQLEVLSHRAVGCFVTHGGWNSTLEALSLGVPMVVAPIWTDQPTNAKLVEDAWGVGIRARADEKGIVRSQVLERCIREVMGGDDDSDRSKEFKSNAMKWKNLAREAVDEGGSSDKCIAEFVAKLSEKPKKQTD